MPHPSFLSAWNFVWSQIWKLTLGLGVNLRRVDIITVMVQSTLPGWHTPIKVEIAFDFTKSLCLNGSRTDFQMIWKQVWWNSGKGVQKASCCPKASSRAFDCPKNTVPDDVHCPVRSYCLLLFNTTETFQTGYISAEICISQWCLTNV